MEHTNPFSFCFAAGKERQRAGSSGEQCPDFNCCRGAREGRELSTDPPGRDVLSKQKTHPELLHPQVLLVGRSIVSGFTAQERIEAHLNPPDHTYRPPLQLRPSTSQGILLLPQMSHLGVQRGTCFPAQGLALKYLWEAGRRWGRGVLDHESWQDTAASPRLAEDG